MCKLRVPILHRYEFGIDLECVFVSLKVQIKKRVIEN